MSDELLNKAVEAVQARLDEAVKQYEGELKENGEASKSAKAAVDALSRDYENITKAQEDVQARLKNLEQNSVQGMRGANEARQTMGSIVTKSDAFEALRTGAANRGKWDIQANTIIGEEGSPQEPSDTLVPADRLPGIVPGAFRSLNILDFVPMGNTSSNAIEYTRELSWTNDAAETEEGGSKPESDLTFELVSEPVRTIPHYIKTSKQIMDDAPALMSYIDQRMRHGVQKRLQTQILKGNGSAPNLEGLSSTNKSTAFTPETGENQFDSLNRAKYAVIGADYEPDFIILNPLDWGAMERLKVGASDDRYLVSSANNAIGYLSNGMTPMIWGLPVVTSNDVASGKFYLGSSAAMMLFMRQGATVEMFEQDGTNVQSNLLTIRAELRAALAGFTPAAIRYGDLTI